MFTGSMVALVTPMTKEQNVDYDALTRLVNFHLENHTDGLVVVGTTGESAVLSQEEKSKIIQMVVEQVQGKIPVIAGTASQGTKQTIEQTKIAESLGVDGALVMTPAYIKPPQRGLIAHYTQIAEETNSPIILYNVPGRTACDLLPESIEVLSKVENIVAVKEASGSVSRAEEIIKRCGQQFAVLSGEDGLALEMMKAGASGVVSVTANVEPKLMHELCHHALNNEWQAAEEVDEKLQPLHDILFCEANPIPTKWALSQMNYCRPDCRLPLTTLSPVHHQSLLSVLKQFDNSL